MCTSTVLTFGCYLFSFFFFLFEAGSCFVHQKAFNLQLSSCLCLPRAGCQHVSPQLAPSSSLNSALPNAFLLADRGWVATRLREKCEALGSISGRQRKEKNSGEGQSGGSAGRLTSLPSAPSPKPMVEGENATELFSDLPPMDSVPHLCTAHNGYINKIV